MKITINPKELGVSLKWYEIWAWGVVLGMALFALWGFYDGLAIGSARAGWRFLLFFAILLVPQVMALFFLRPKRNN
ncbi:MAG: hypothetical protein JRJ71_12945 [Deltaproteobacteria bacterium]|nr:hypothetical protein [Deltaproteobacteria bacterium]